MRVPLLLMTMGLHPRVHPQYDDPWCDDEFEEEMALEEAEETAEETAVEEEGDEDDAENDVSAQAREEILQGRWPEEFPYPDIPTTGTSAVVKENCHEWARMMGFPIAQRRDSEKEGRATFLCGCKGREAAAPPKDREISAPEQSRIRQSMRAAPSKKSANLR